ncbi:hypothetical protein EES43_20955 [Streptomyces sp. ADI96-02]|uniref:hypothetical protein n=1 Tax=Streptomyces sp. ADI96-02 TaxID=1522760 RepID=UPI000F558D33|nr:hypothetical protein [Streptomyces sp. ADI96-02]RPK57820.1 hypothetical protein EES43_20955 [Streptomyces sp. ADI96-02]
MVAVPEAGGGHGQLPGQVHRGVQGVDVDLRARSHSGWHRHVTLASDAHAVAVLSSAADARPLRAC